MKRLILILLLAAFAPGCRYVKNASDVAYDEFSARPLLKKYEWFKDASAKLDAKLASIKVAEGQLARLEKQHEGMARKDWPRTDLETHSLREQEVAGLKMSFNQLAAEYNARMVKENHAFCNVGDMPRGTTKPLPREYKEYLDR